MKGAVKTAFDYQVENVIAGARRNVLIADECGLGKTFSSVLIAKAGRIGPIEELPWRGLVVCPKAVRTQWIAEIKLEDPGIPITELYYGQRLNNYIGWHIIHYEALLAYPPTDILWDIVIADEAHRIKNRHAKRTKAIKSLHAVRKVALTGTPFDKDVSEMWSILNWLYPYDFKSYQRFKDAYVEFGYNRGGYMVPIGPKNVAELAERLGSRFIRHTKMQVAPQMPPKIMVTIPLKMEDAQLEVYNSIRKARDIELDIGGNTFYLANALAKLGKLQQAASDPSTIGIPANSIKVDWVVDFVDDSPKQRVVIFCRFKATAAHIAQLLREHGHNPTEFMGTQGKKKYPQDFVDGVTNILVATIAMAGEGLDLKGTEAAIFVDREWSSIRMSQAHDRIHRIGIKQCVMIYNLSCSPVDELVDEALESKWSDKELVMKAIERHMFNGEDNDPNTHE